MQRGTRTARHRPASGFTLVELVMVLLIIGVLAVFALPRLLDISQWRLRAYGDELQAQSMAMQRLALVQRRPVLATFTTTGVTFTYVAGGATLVNLACPASESPCIAESGTRSATFNDSNTGRTTTSTGAALPVTLGSGSNALTYRLEAETGLFRPFP